MQLQCMFLQINQWIDFLELLLINSLTLSKLSLVFPDFGLPLFPLCKSPIAPSLLSLRTTLVRLFFVLVSIFESVIESVHNELEQNFFFDTKIQSLLCAVHLLILPYYMT